MSRRERITKELIVEPGTEANIAGRDPAWSGGTEFEQLSAKQLSRTAKALLASGVKELAKAQELLWASDTNALLVVFQALDAAGKEAALPGVTQLRRYGIALLAIIAVTTIGFLQRIFGTVELSFSLWSICIGIAASLVVVEELIKLVVRQRDRRRVAAATRLSVSGA